MCEQAVTYDDAVLRIVAAHQPIKMMKIVAHLMLERDEVATYDVQRCVSRLLNEGALLQDDQFCYRTKRTVVTISVRVGAVESSISRALSEDIYSNDEETVARLAEQLARAAVRKHYK